MTTMTDAAAILGYAKPATPRQTVCADCGSDEIVWGDEITDRSPFGSGYSILLCLECGAAVEDERVWVGHCA